MSRLVEEARPEQAQKLSRQRKGQMLQVLAVRASSSHYQQTNAGMVFYMSHAFAGSTTAADGASTGAGDFSAGGSAHID